MVVDTFENLEKYASCGKKIANIPGFTATYVSANPSKKVMSFSAL